MKASTKENLEAQYKWCTDNEKSIEFTLQYLQDTCNVSFDTAVKFIKSKSKYSKP